MGSPVVVEVKREWMNGVLAMVTRADGIPIAARRLRSYQDFILEIERYKYFTCPCQDHLDRMTVTRMWGWASAISDNYLERVGEDQYAS